MAVAVVVGVAVAVAVVVGVAVAVAVVVGVAVDVAVAVVVVVVVVVAVACGCGCGWLSNWPSKWSSGLGQPEGTRSGWASFSDERTRGACTKAAQSSAWCLHLRTVPLRQNESTLSGSHGWHRGLIKRAKEVIGTAPRSMACAPQCSAMMGARERK